MAPFGEETYLFVRLFQLVLASQRGCSIGLLAEDTLALPAPNIDGRLSIIGWFSHQGRHRDTML